MTSKYNFVTIFIFALFLFSMAAWALEILIQKILETILVETGKSKMNQVLIEMRITQKRVVVKCPLRSVTEAYSEPSQTSEIERFTKIVNG